ncbi:hypothetical protein [Loigolactobacillus backii]|uniref:hypothetical protein n=1 Tax=Loigolactobacillus backii TaxID=375175 RepID=UPI0007F15107|nr:hypothetical protein [Loigolactobacillus backii]ANK59826.1 hypothetical protein AYR52_05855 [Loigolactobacillus backii]
MAKGKYQQWITKEGLLKIEGWARDGLTDEQIAQNIGIRRPTLYDWKNKHSDISNALKKGKEVVDRQVENALLKRALGTTTTEKQSKMIHIDDDILAVKRHAYENKWKLDHEEATEREIKDAAIAAVPEYKKIPIIEIKHELPPDTTAQIFWLKNRKPKEWRDKRETELSGGVNTTNPFKDLSAEELRKLADDHNG